MSRIGKVPVPVPAGVKVGVSAAGVVVEGPLGSSNGLFAPRPKSSSTRPSGAWSSPATATAAKPKPIMA